LSIFISREGGRQITSSINVLADLVNHSTDILHGVTVVESLSCQVVVVVRDHLLVVLHFLHLLVFEAFHDSVDSGFILLDTLV